MATGYKYRISQLIHYFIPFEYQNDESTYQSSKIRVSIFLITAFFYLLYTPNALSINIIEIAIVHFIAAGLIIITLYCHKYKWNPITTAHMYLFAAGGGIFSGIVFLGGLTAPPGIMLIPAIAMLVGNKKVAIVWLFICIVSYTIIYQLSESGFLFKPTYEPSLRNYMYYTSNLGIIISLFFCLMVFDNEIKSAIKKILQINDELNAEKEKSENLILNILPSQIASELKETGDSKARHYQEVTILFTDFVNFTGISEQLDPNELVDELHKQFTLFDQIMEKHGLEKIKTIGDAYLAASGLPIENKNHASNAVNAAIEIIDSLNKNNSKFQVKIGINSGSVVAGIVGVKKYAYDIWGDSVNIASRLEQHSEPGKINISESTYQLVKDQFQFKARGEIMVKNKGMLEMFFVEPLNEG